jgi:putative PIN family toxin of toxin-antitoxin system
MQKIVIDTNIIVSSLIQQGYPNLIIKELFIEQKIQLCVSDEFLLSVCVLCFQSNKL